MPNEFTINPLSEEELKIAGSYQLTLEVKPIYAPSIVKAFFRGNEWKLMTAEKIAEGTGLPLKQVRCILLRLVAEHFVYRRISNWKNKTEYYFFSDGVNTANKKLSR